MPGMNGTGPSSDGPMTGGGFGPCGQGRAWRGSRPGRGTSYGAGRAAARPGLRRWFDFGFLWRGWRPFGWDRPYGADIDEEKNFLKAQAVDLKAKVAGLEKRLANLEQSQSAKDEA